MRFSRKSRRTHRPTVRAAVLSLVSHSEHAACSDCRHAARVRAAAGCAGLRWPQRPLWQRGGGLAAKRFALMMKKVIEKGDSFIVAETARLHSLLDDPSVAPAQVRRTNHRPMRRDAPLAVRLRS